MKKLIDPNIQRAERMMEKWPEWKRDYQITKYKSEKASAGQSTTKDCKTAKDGFDGSLRVVR